jgi:hypothetical protein
MSIQSVDFDRRLGWARHEAGHVLARLYCGQTFEFAVVLSDEELSDSTPHWGFVEAREFRPTRKVLLADSAFWRMTLEHDLIYKCAGSLAETPEEEIDYYEWSELQGNYCSTEDWSTDLRQFETLLDILTVSPHRRNLLAQRAIDRAIALVTSTKGEVFIENLAGVLMQTRPVTPDECEPMFIEMFGSLPWQTKWLPVWPPSIDQIAGGYVP